MSHASLHWPASIENGLIADSRTAGPVARLDGFTTRRIATRPPARRAGTPVPASTGWDDGSPASGRAGLTPPSPHLATSPSPHPAPAFQRARTIGAFLKPLEDAAGRSRHLVRRAGLRFTRGGESHELPRYTFVGPGGGDEAMRIGIFATVHGDEPESGLGLRRFLEGLVGRPDAARGFVIDAYPVCNPTGYEDATRHARGGTDLNRGFWRNSGEPEVRLLEGELRRHAFHGIISLHCDDTSHGLYGFLSGRSASAVLSASLLEPALGAAGAFLPRNFDSKIDGFHARGGVLTTCYDGVLRAPDGLKMPPFEITFETPQRAEVGRQVEAFNAALHTILAEYRQLLAHAPNL